MRLSVALLFLTGLVTSTRSYSQHISFSLKDASLEEVLDTLEKAGHCTITCNRDRIRFHHLQVTVENATLEEAVKECLNGLPFDYKFTDSHSISLSRRKVTQFKGSVFWDEPEGLERLTVQVLNGSLNTMTDNKGQFVLPNLPDSATLVISGVNIVTRYVQPEGREMMNIEVEKKAGVLSEVTVQPFFHNGYENQRANASPPASWYPVDASLLTVGAAIDPLTPLRGQASGVMVGTGANNSSHISVRGVNTFFASREPLIIVDNFPYAGDIRDINVCDVESITVLKDPAASTMWGARAGNGVLIITSRKGSATPKSNRLSLVANTVLAQKPNLAYWPVLSPKADLGLEELLFNRGLYDDAFYDISRPAVPPMVEVLDRQRNGNMTQAEVDASRDAFSKHSLIKDLSRSYYRTALRQQYFLSLSGGNLLQQYYLSAGYDRDPTILVNNQFERYTLHASFHQSMFQDKLDVSALGNYADIQTKDNNTGSLPVNYLYAGLTGPHGEPLAVNYGHSSGYTDTAGGGYLKDWTYRPKQELNLANNHTRITNVYGQVGLRYHILPQLTLEGLYRYMTGTQTVSNRYSQDSYYMRDLWNGFTKPGMPGSSYILAGDALDRLTTRITAHYLRAQVNYAHPDTTQQQWGYNINAGAERSGQVVHNETMRLYGYNPDLNAGVQMGSGDEYPDYVTGELRKIPVNQGYQNSYTYFISFFANMSVSVKDRLTLYGVARKDATNIVGVNTNHRWAPFWALSIGYDATGKTTDTSNLPPILQFKAGYGSNGNVGNRIGSLSLQPLDPNNYGDPQSVIATPPNPYLSWEKTSMFNVGLDFGVARDGRSQLGRIHGSLDFYFKRGQGLLGDDTLAPSAGRTSFFSNSASMKGGGIDLVLNTENIRGAFRWTTTLLLSFVEDKVTRYNYLPFSVSGYVQSNTPKAGRPISAVFSFRDAGLDPTNGDPRGYLDGQPSNKYQDIMYGKNEESIVYSGSYQPAVFGGLTNTFSLQRWTLSMLIDIKTLFIFRRSSINYYQYVAGQEPGHKDYNDSWKVPGDENRTHIPSPPVFNDIDRSSFYAYSQSTITPGDFIRLQNIRLSRDFLTEKLRKYGFRQMIVSFSVNQAGILWRANRYKIDPEAPNPGDLPPTRSFILSLRLGF